MSTSTSAQKDNTRIVILGGGFAGLYSALHFEKTIASDPAVEMTLVSRENFVLFTPMLYEWQPATERHPQASMRNHINRI